MPRLQRIRKGGAVMACQPFTIGGVSGFMCGPRKRSQPCAVPGCGRPHIALCDYELAVPIESAGRAQTSANTREAIKTMHPQKTCDMKLCTSHLWKVPGKEDRDLCPVHRKMTEKTP